MKQSEERYISLLTDFGFKRIFGTDLNKDLLINFLNSLFNGEEVIKDVKFDAAAIARFTPIELREYEDSLKAYRDIKNSLDTAEAKGREEGINIANLAIAKRMLSDGMDMELVLKYTGLTEKQIKK
uniref:PD-(D/E)XK nuclease family transposase n=1 Tax=Prevotella sp. TaxID=59823 RepID=UPI0040278D70